MQWGTLVTIPSDHPSNPTPYLQIEHEETCEYRPYQCPCPGASCKWQGSLEQVLTSVHFTHSNPNPCHVIH